MEITGLGVPFIPYADTITELPQVSECLISASDFCHGTTFFTEQMGTEPVIKLFLTQLKFRIFKRLFMPPYVTP